MEVEYQKTALVGGFGSLMGSICRSLTQLGDTEVVNKKKIRYVGDTAEM